MGYTLSDDIKSIWKSSDSLLRATNSTLLDISTAVKALWAYADKKAADDAKAVSNDAQNKNKQEDNAVGAGQATTNTPSTSQTTTNTSNKSSTTSNTSNTNNPKTPTNKTPTKPSNTKTKVTKPPANHTGLWTESNGSTFYYIKGKLQKGWQTVNGGKRYFNSKDGHMLVGLQKIGNKQYYFNKNTGVLQTGKFLAGDVFYQADEKGVIIKKLSLTVNKNSNISTGTSKVAKAYATGSQSISKDQMAWTSDAGQELIYNSKSGAILTPLRKGDKVFTAAMSENLWNISKPDGLEAIIGSMIPEYINSAMGELQSVLNGSQKFNYGNVTQHFDNITFSLPNVKDYDSLVRQMQNDKKFENLIQSMTIGRINGKSSASKRHINI